MNISTRSKTANPQVKKKIELRYPDKRVEFVDAIDLGALEEKGDYQASAVSTARDGHTVIQLRKLPAKYRALRERLAAAGLRKL